VGCDSGEEPVVWQTKVKTFDHKKSDKLETESVSVSETEAVLNLFPPSINKCGLQSTTFHFRWAGGVIYQLASKDRRLCNSSNKKIHLSDTRTALYYPPTKYLVIDSADNECICNIASLNFERTIWQKLTNC